MNAAYLELVQEELDTVGALWPGFGTVEVAGDYYIFGHYAPPCELNFERKTLRMLPDQAEGPNRCRRTCVYRVDDIRKLHPRQATDNATVLTAPAN